MHPTSDNASAHPASVFDREVGRVIPFYAAFNAEILDLVRTVSASPAGWLDTGGGTGALIASALPCFPTTRFFLADPSDAMLAEARARFAGVPAGRVSILPPARSEQLTAWQPRPPLQVVTAVLCHHYLSPEERRVAVQGCFELLEPGGLFVTVETIDRNEARGREIGLARWRAFQLAQGREPAEVNAHLARFHRELKPVRIADHLDLLHGAGFGIAELFWTSHLQAGFFAIKPGVAGRPRGTRESLF